MDIWVGRGRIILQVVFVLMAGTYAMERLLFHAVVGASGVGLTLVSSAVLVGLAVLIYQGYGWLRCWWRAISS